MVQDLMLKLDIKQKKLKVSNNQEMVRSERNFLSENRGGKKLIGNRVLTLRTHIVS